MVKTMLLERQVGYSHEKTTNYRVGTAYFDDVVLGAPYANIKNSNKMNFVWDISNPPVNGVSLGNCVWQILFSLKTWSIIDANPSIFPRLGYITTYCWSKVRQQNPAVVAQIVCVCQIQVQSSQLLAQVFVSDLKGTHLHRQSVIIKNYKICPNTNI